MKLRDGHDLVFQQPILNVAHTVAPHVHHKNLPYDVRRFQVGQEMVPVVGIYDVPIGHSAVDALPTLGLGLFDGPDFLGRIAGVKLVEEMSNIRMDDKKLHDLTSVHRPCGDWLEKCRPV